MVNRGPSADDTRNVILAIALSLAVMLGFQYLFPPSRETPQETRAAQAPAVAAPVAPEREVGRTQAQRIPIRTPQLGGSLLLTGARIDDLNLREFRQTTKPDSPEVRLLAPRGAAGAADAFFGWEANLDGDGERILAASNSAWTADEGARLTPESPVTLRLRTPEGVEFTRTISVDRDYMFTIEDRARNEAGRPIQVRPFGVVRRQGAPPPAPNVHQGLAGVFGPGESLNLKSYGDAEKHAREKAKGRRGDEARILEQAGTGGWLGLSDHYWLTSLVPDQNERISGWYDSRVEDGQTDIRAAYRGQWRTLQPGGEATYTQRLFAGAKDVDVLRMYQHALNLPDFDRAVDWGLLFLVTRPLFELLHFFGQRLGHFGLAILVATIIVKLLLFPLVYQSNVAMTKLRKLQPKMQEIQEKYKADKQRQQQEMIRLYQVEKINPVAGCLPVLLQLPVFLALYKVLSVTVEMRHAPFFGWIQDLSARDPTNIFNLFGLLPFEPQTWPLVGGILWLGAWPILYGMTMSASMALSPPPTDPTQKMVFRFMPILFTFMIAGIAVGIAIYWTWSNILGVLQQYVIMRRMGVETEFDKVLARWLRREAPTAAE
jgi:YidC/Oxa1 family membrane protein insertase